MYHIRIVNKICEDIMGYKVWENQCNAFMLKKHGVGVDDIPDMPWYDWYKDELTPEEAVELAIDKINNDGWW